MKSFFWKIALCAVAVIDSSAAQATFKSSPEIRMQLRIASQYLKSLENSADQSEDRQNFKFKEWGQLVTHFKNCILTDQNSVCKIEVRQMNNEPECIQISPQLMDSGGNTYDLSCLELTLLKKTISSKMVNGKNLFFCDGVDRYDCAKYRMEERAVPQLSGPLRAFSNRDIYSNVEVEKQLTRETQILQITCGFRIENGDPIEGLPCQCYFNVKSEKRIPTRIVRVSAGSFYLMEHRLGRCSASQLNGEIGIRVSNSDEFTMESLYSTNIPLSVIVNSDPGDGLFRIQENGTLQALDSTLNPDTTQEPIRILLEKDDFLPEYVESSTASLQQLADTFNNNLFLTRIDLGEHPFDQDFLQFLTAEARQRLKKVVVKNSELTKKFLSKNQKNQNTWFPRLEKILIKSSHGTIWID